MRKTRKILLLSVLVFFGAVTVVPAQSDAVSSITNAFRSIQSAGSFDGEQFVQQVARINQPDLLLSDADIEALHKAAAGFAKGSDHDKESFVRSVILSSLSRREFYRAIDYGKQNIPFFEQNRGPHRVVMLQSFIQQMRIPYRNSDRIGEGFAFYNDLLRKSQAIGDRAGTVTAYYVLSGFYRTIGLIDVAIYNMKKALALVDTTDRHPDVYFTTINNFSGINAWTNFAGIMGEYYNIKGEYQTAVSYSRMALSRSLQFVIVNAPASYHLKNLALSMLELNKLDSASFYLDEAEKLTPATDKARRVTAMQVRSLLYLKQGDLAAADSVVKECWNQINAVNLNTVTPSGVVAPDYYLALVRNAQGRSNEAISLLKRDLQRVRGVRVDMLRDYKLLGETYEKTGDQRAAKESFASYIRLQDSLLADQSRFRDLSFEMEEQLAQNGKTIDQLQADKKLSRVLWMFSLGIVVLLVVLSLLINQRYRVKRKANAVLEKTLTELKHTQSQLVQSEKMASLGELTAGIAHEIQNPLNFVNNFSDLNQELVEEMAEELDKGNNAEVKQLAQSISENSAKISHHGKRADAIVKGMLQHSRSSSGQKEPVDVNVLCDEYLRLAYHGLRAKDKSFNAAFETDFDASIGKTNMQQQEMGRVILNLINNAFYAVNARKKLGEANYQPKVIVRTRKTNETVQMIVEDNGTGISQKLLDKIFQPFFTTKPTGEGTGLGLSLSYDIITKAHGGTLTVESLEGKGTTFTIQIPRA